MGDGEEKDKTNAQTISRVAIYTCRDTVAAAKDQGRSQTPSVYNYDRHLARRDVHLLIVSHLFGYIFFSSPTHTHFKTVLRIRFHRSLGHISLMASRSVPPPYGPTAGMTSCGYCTDAPIVLLHRCTESYTATAAPSPILQPLQTTGAPR